LEKGKEKKRKELNLEKTKQKKGEKKRRGGSGF